MRVKKIPEIQNFPKHQSPKKKKLNKTGASFLEVLREVVHDSKRSDSERAHKGEQ